MTSSRTILIIEDDSWQAESLGDLLDLEGYQSISGDTCAKGLELARETRPPVALLDIKLPDGSGTDLLHEIRNAVPDCTCIMMSAYAEVETTLQALNRGATHFLRKPINPPELLSALKVAFEMNALREAKRTAEIELRASEERYRDMIDRSPDVVWRMNREGVLTFVSQAIKPMSGFDPDEMVGLPFEKFRNEFLVGDSDDAARETLERRLRGDLGTEETVYELTYYRKDGSQYTAELRSFPVLDEDGEIVEIHGITRDISERKIVEAERVKLEQQLRESQKMEAVGTLAGGVAHELNNRLTAINLYTEMLLEDLEPDQPLHQDLSELRQASERAAELTQQLLAFSRKQILEPKAFDLGEMVMAAKSTLRRMIGTPITLDLRVDTSLKKVTADPAQIDQVIRNLVLNARDAMPGGGSITVSVANIALDHRAGAALDELPPGDYVMLGVSDTGCGMDERLLSRIFEPFFTTRDVHQGTGLGLSAVLGIIKQSGGGIGVESEPGKGSIFRVYLPKTESS